RLWWPCVGLPTAMDANVWKNADRTCPPTMRKCRHGGYLPGRYAHGCTRFVLCTVPTMPHFLGERTCRHAPALRSSAGGKSVHRTVGTIHRNRKPFAPLPAPAAHVAAGFWD